MWLGEVGRVVVWLGEDWKGWVRFDDDRRKRLGEIWSGFVRFGEVE